MHVWRRKEEEENGNEAVSEWVAITITIIKKWKALKMVRGGAAGHTVYECKRSKSYVVSYFYEEKAIFNKALLFLFSLVLSFVRSLSHGCINVNVALFSVTLNITTLIVALCDEIWNTRALCTTYNNMNWVPFVPSEMKCWKHFSWAISGIGQFWFSISRNPSLACSRSLSQSTSVWVRYNTRDPQHLRFTHSTQYSLSFSLTVTM